MEKIIKYTYMLDIAKIEKEFDRLWERYQKILAKPTWETLNEARAILFFIGNLYTEKIGPEAIERRLHLLQKPLNILDFYHLIDSKSNKLKSYRGDNLFVKLEYLYLVIRKNKNRFVGGKLYMDEDKFIELYNRYNPESGLSIKKNGKF